ncbi:MAG: pilus assembly protein PilM [Oligoflexia bacterium]|nr:MAG: pilus assembly protein PilM [Oligoflexia bacterium]
MFFGSKKVIGLDIGSSSIKMAELNVKRGGAELVSFGFVPTPQGALGGGDINNVQAVSEAISALSQQIKSRRKNVATGMWGTAVIVKKITIPRIEKKLVAQQIRWEAEQYIPFDVNEISLAYHIVNGQSAADTMDILLIAAQNALVGQYSQAVSGAGYKLGVLDVSGFALANIFELNYGRLRGQTIGLLNLGASVTNFVVLHDGEVIFCRDIPIGGYNYTNEIHKEMGVTIPEAEALKLSAVSGNEVPDQVHSILSSVNDVMVDEIRNSFDFFNASTAGYAINQVYFTGGSSGMPNLINQVSQATQLPFEAMNPFLKIKPGKGFTPDYLQQIAPFTSVVLGLALRNTGDS